MLPLKEYRNIKDKYCVAYLGYCREYWVLLKYLRPHIEKCLPGIEIHFCCRPELQDLLENEPNTMTADQMPRKRDLRLKFGFFKEITTGLYHPIQELMEESNLPYPPKPQLVGDVTTFSIASKGTLPTKSLTPQQVERAAQLGQGKEETNLLSDWVIGVESEALFAAAVQGKKTSLIPTGIGTELYKSLFHGEVLKF